MRTVRYNVGGTVMEITEKLLTKYPDSKLAHSANLGLGSVTNESLIFLDYNPYAFMAILDYLRTGTLYCPRNTSTQLILKLLDELGIPLCDPLDIDAEIKLPLVEYSVDIKNAGIQALTQNGLPPAYDESEKSERCSTEQKINHDLNTPQSSNHRYTQSLDNQQKIIYKRLESMIFAGLLPLISKHVDLGHTQLRLYIVPEIFSQGVIANNTEIEDVGFPKDFYQTCELMSFLMQPQVLELIQKIIRSATNISNTSIQIRNFTCRLQNAFGLYESQSTDVLVITMFFPPNCTF